MFTFHKLSSINNKIRDRLGVVKCTLIDSFANLQIKNYLIYTHYTRIVLAEMNFQCKFQKSAEAGFVKQVNKVNNPSLGKRKQL